MRGLLYRILRVYFEVRMLYAAFLEAIDDLGTDNNVLYSLIYLLPKLFREEVVSLKGVRAGCKILATFT